MAYEPSQQEMTAYFIALGTLHHNYTQLEHSLTCTVSLVVTEGRSGMPYDVAIAVLGGMRMSTLKDTIKRLQRVLKVKKSEREAVDKVFSHLGDIQFFRDRLAHHTTEPVEKDMWRNDDYAAAREFEKSQKLQFKTSAMHAAAVDLNAIRFYLDGLFEDYVTMPDGVDPPKPFDPEVPTWIYRPSMLIRAGR